MGPTPAISTRAVSWLSAAIALIMIAQQVASKAVRDGLFLTEFDVTALPAAAAAAAAVSLVAALLFGRFISTCSPAAAVPVLFGLNGVLFLAEAALSPSFPRGVSAGLYLHTAALGAAVASGFWSVINERFDPYTARQVMGRIATGAALGGLVGGVGTWLVSDVRPVLLLAALGASNWTCGIALARVASGESRRIESQTPPRLFDGVAVLREHSYPRLLALLVLLCALMTSVADYVFKAGATAAVGTSLVGFFAVFYAGTGILGFAVQSALSSRLLKTLGVVATLTLFPMFGLVALSWAIFVPSLAALVVLRGGLMVVENSIYRSAYELLYTPMPASQKRSGKMLIDLGSDRVGTAAGSGLALLCLALAAAYATTLLLTIGLLAAGVILAVLALVQRHYVSSLAANIRRSQTVGVASGVDPLAFTFGDGGDRIPWQGETPGGVGSASPADTGIARDELVALVRARAGAKVAAGAAGAAAAVTSAVVVSERFLATPLVAQLAAAAPGSPTWVELERSAPAMVGQLSDILLSARRPLEMRLHAAELLAAIPSRRVAAAFEELLDATEFRLRRIGALGLLRLRAAAPSLAPSSRSLSRRAARELRQPAQRTLDETPLERASPFRLDAGGHRFAPGFELAMTLLAIAGDTAALQLAVAAVTSADPAQRGTGLEYLDSVMPADVRAAVLALAASPSRTRTDQRIADNEMVVLAGELRSGRVTLRELRRRHRALMDAR